MYRVDLIIVQIDDERNHDKGNLYIQGTYSLLYSVIYNNCLVSVIEIFMSAVIFFFFNGSHPLGILQFSVGATFEKRPGKSRFSLVCAHDRATPAAADSVSIQIRTPATQCVVLPSTPAPDFAIVRFN